MATRSTTHFMFSAKETAAIVYRHWDGYPEVAGEAILRFLRTVKENTADTRFGDAEYLAARYVAFLADEFSSQQSFVDGVWVEKALPKYAFISVGVCMSDPGDIEYRYRVHCWDVPTSEGLPPVTYDNVYDGSSFDLNMEAINV